MARLHAIPPADGGKVPEASVFTTTKKWIGTLPTKFDDAAKQEK